MAASPLEIVKSVIDAIMRKDFDLAFNYFDENVQYTNIALRSAFGKSDARALVERLFAPTLASETRYIRFAVDEICTFIERVDRHRLSSGWVELPVVGVFEFRDGRISVWRDYLDRQPLLDHWPTPLE